MGFGAGDDPPRYYATVTTVDHKSQLSRQPFDLWA